MYQSCTTSLERVLTVFNIDLMLMLGNVSENDSDYRLVIQYFVLIFLGFVAIQRCSYQFLSFNQSLIHKRKTGRIVSCRAFNIII